MGRPPPLGQSKDVCVQLSGRTVGCWSWPHCRLPPSRMVHPSKQPGILGPCLQTQAPRTDTPLVHPKKDTPLTP